MQVQMPNILEPVCRVEEACTRYILAGKDILHVGSGAIGSLGVAVQ